MASEMEMRRPSVDGKKLHDTPQTTEVDFEVASSEVYIDKTKEAKMMRKFDVSLCNLTST